MASRKRHAVICFCSQHGVGDELVLAGPLISAWLRAGLFTSVWTFHPSLYVHERLIVHSWLGNPLQKFVPIKCDYGICIGTIEARRLPTEYDRSGLTMEACREAGWLVLDDDNRQPIFCTKNPYDEATQLLRSMALDVPTPPWEFLPYRRHKHILLNLMAGVDLAKGLPPPIAEQVSIMLAHAFPHQAFVVILIEGGPAWSEGYRPSNLVIKVRPFGSADITNAYCTARLIVSAEGGGYHMAYGAAVKCLLVTSIQWFSVTSQYALPPNDHNTVLFNGDKAGSEVQVISSKIARWIRYHY